MFVLKKISLFTVSLLLMMGLVSCDIFFSNLLTDEMVLAKVGANYLYESDLKGDIPNGLNPQDSLVWMQTYINNWVREQLLVKKAKENLKEEEKNFNRELLAYKNSLLVYEYEKMLVKQQLDSIVTDHDIVNYYNQYAHNFILPDTIAKVIYVIIPRDSATLRYPLRNIMKQDTIYDYTIIDFATEHDLTYFIAKEEWMEWQSLRHKLPIHLFYLTTSSIFPYSKEVYYNGNYYNLRIEDLVSKDSIAPLPLVKRKIVDIIKNKRKLQIIDDLRKNILSTSKHGVDYEIY